tara:strand:- start:1174 stop:1821 length:648 start_codon:yes stop_codon:yes gene_type:complete
MRRQLDFSKTRECGLPDALLSGIFRAPIGEVDVFSVERWNGLRTIATSFRMDIEFREHVYPRRIQLFHPFGVYPFPQYKIDSIKEREKEGWKGFILSGKLSAQEIELVSHSFLEYPVQGTDSMLEYYKKMEELKKEIKAVKESFKVFVGRVCMVQVVDTNAKDHSGTKRNFSLSQFLSERAAKSIYNAYKTNLKDDFTLSQVGAGLVEIGYGGAR